MNRLTKTLILGPVVLGTVNGATNFVPGVSETVELAGPFGHAGGIGDADNSLTTATFVGGFDAEFVSLAGTLDHTGGLPATWGREAAINFTQPDSTVLGGVSIDGSLSQTYTPPFEVSNDLIGIGAALDPAGEWSLEMFETYDDGAGIDQFSTGLSITFSSAGTDANIEEAMGVLGAGGSASSAGDLGLSALIDTYTFTLDTAGLFTVTTSANLAGLVGADVDTELGLFDAAGVLLNFDDDGGEGTFSQISTELPAGDYTIAVGSFDTNLEDLTVDASVLGDVVGGAGVGDYAIDFSLVPEPSTGMLALFASLGLLRRRR